MNKTTIRTLYRQTPADGSVVTVYGWVRTVRDSKTFGFIELNDGTFFKNLQVVLVDGRLPNFKEAVKLTVGTAVKVTGVLELTPAMKQPFEIKADELTVEGTCPSDYPLQKKRHTLEYLRTIQHLRPRTNTFQATFRVRSVLAAAIHEFFQHLLPVIVKALSLRDLLNGGLTPGICLKSGAVAAPGPHSCGQGSGSPEDRRCFQHLFSVHFSSSRVSAKLSIKVSRKYATSGSA